VASCKPAAVYSGSLPNTPLPDMTMSTAIDNESGLKPITEIDSDTPDRNSLRIPDPNISAKKQNSALLENGNLYKRSSSAVSYRSENNRSASRTSLRSSDRTNDDRPISRASFRTPYKIDDDRPTSRTSVRSPDRSNDDRPTSRTSAVISPDRIDSPLSAKSDPDDDDDVSSEILRIQQEADMRENKNGNFFRVVRMIQVSVVSSVILYYCFLVRMLLVVLRLCFDVFVGMLLVV